MDSRLAPINTNFYGILWALLAGLFFTVMMALVKSLGSKFPSVEIVFFRSLVQLLLLLFICTRTGFSTLKTKRPMLQGLRALIAVALINCNFYAFTKMPLADVTAIGFSRNLFIVVLAFLFLGERPTINRLSMTLIGFIGIMVIVRPGSGVFGGVAWVALTGACLGAVMMILIRKLTATDSNIAIMTFHSLAIVLTTSIPVVLLWVMPTLYELLLLVSMAGMGIMGQWCMIQAFRRGEATAVAPASYVRLIYATIVGFYFFSELPDLYTVIGAFFIVGSNFFLIMQEYRTRKVKPGPPVTGDIVGQG